MAGKQIIGLVVHQTTAARYPLWTNLLGMSVKGTQPLKLSGSAHSWYLGWCCTISHKFHVVRISADLARFGSFWLCLSGVFHVCLSGVFHHLKCLAVFITDTQGVPEQYSISPMWFELQLIWLKTIGVTFWACLSGVSHLRNCLTMIIPDTWGGIEQYPISFRWFRYPSCPVTIKLWVWTVYCLCIPWILWKI